MSRSTAGPTALLQPPPSRRGARRLSRRAGPCRPWSRRRRALARLDRHGPLFLGAEGEVYPITPNGGEGQNRYVCRPLLEIYRKIFRQADIPGLCTQSARLTLMSRMYERGADEDQVGLVLGIADRSAVREQLPRPRPELAKVLEGAGMTRRAR